MATVCFKARATSAPAYLRSMLVPHVTSRSLRSSHAPRLAVPRTRTVSASRAFSVAAPTVWNSLPDNVVNSDTLATFKKLLKTRLFHCVMWNVISTERPLHFLLWRYVLFIIDIVTVFLQQFSRFTEMSRLLRDLFREWPSRGEAQCTHNAVAVTAVSRGRRTSINRAAQADSFSCPSRETSWCLPRATACQVYLTPTRQQSNFVPETN